MNNRKKTREYVKVVASGKTKVIRQSRWTPSEGRVISLNDTTAENGKIHEVIPGKGRLVNEVACNIFMLLHRHGVPVAYRRWYDKTSFITTLCEMVKLEIVIRFEVDPEGSYKKRNPDVPDGYRFEKPIVEVFIKTTGKKWGVWTLPCDDPFIVWNGDGYHGVYLPDVPLAEQKALFWSTGTDLGLKRDSDIETVWTLAEKVGTVIGDAFKDLGAKLIDFKFEVGYTPTGELVVADVISPDEWRMMIDIGKQGFRKMRDNAKIVRAKYHLAALLTEHFRR